MDTFTDVMQILEKLKPELAEKYHVSSIGLFGSIVRDDFTSESDVDILVDFNQPISIPKSIGTKSGVSGTESFTTILGSTVPLSGRLRRISYRSS